MDQQSRDQASATPRPGRAGDEAVEPTPEPTPESAPEPRTAEADPPPIAQDDRPEDR